MTEIYSAGIMSQSFWFVEFKKILKLSVDGKDNNEIKNEIINNNAFGLPNAYRTGRVCGYLMNRYSQMDGTLKKLFFSSDLQTQKLINLICILRQDRLFFEFIYEVYREKKMIGAEFLEAADGKTFMHTKEMQSEDVASWKDATKKRVLSCYYNFLTECGMLTADGRKRKITPPILDIALERYLEANGEIAITKAIAGVY